MAGWRRGVGLLIAGVFVWAVFTGVSLFRQTSVVLGKSEKDGEAVLPLIQLADGRKISVYAALNDSIRQVAVADDGWVFLGTRGDKVYAVRDADGDGTAEIRQVVASGLNNPHGVAFHRGDLYIGEIPAIHVIEDILPYLEEGRSLPAPTPFITGLPTSGHHGMRHIEVDSNGDLYVGLGVPCNICLPSPDGLAAVIRRYSADDRQGEVVAHGVRNAVGFDFHPVTRELWFTDNGRDWMGDDLPSDELNRLGRAGDHFGFPYCHQGDVEDPEFGSPGVCSQYVAPALLTGAHVAGLGMAFDRSGAEVFVALHGSWNRSEKVGYAVYRARLRSNEVTEYAPYATGWLQPGDKVYGRPVDVALMDDDSLLVSDDYGGVLYRIAP